MPTQSSQSVKLATEPQISPPSQPTKSIYWLKHYPWKYENNNKLGNFISRFDSCSSLQSNDPCSPHPVSSDSVTTSNRVIPPTSPMGTQDDVSTVNHVPHRCHNPFECARRARRTRSLLARTHVLSYLPPFRHCEQTSPAELRARRLFTYFHQYPYEAPPALMRLPSVDSNNKHVSCVRQYSNAFEVTQPTRPCTRSHSLSSFSDYPYLTDSENAWLRPGYSRSSPLNLRIMEPQPSRPTFSRTGALSSHEPKINNRKRPSAGLRTEETASASLIALTDCGMELRQDSFPSSCMIEGSTDWSFCLPCASPVDSSMESLTTAPHRVSECLAPPSPYIDEGNGYEQSRLADCVTHSINSPCKHYPSGPFLVESQSSQLILPDPPSGIPQSVTSMESVNWPPTPLELLTSPSPVALISPVPPTMTRAQFTVSHQVVNILILPACDSCPSVSPTLVSPPTEVVLADSMCDKSVDNFSPSVDQTSFSVHVARAHTHPAQLQPPHTDTSGRIDGLGDRLIPTGSPIHSSPASSTMKSNEMTYELNSLSLPPTKQLSPSTKNQGDCVADSAADSPYTVTVDCRTYSRKAPPYMPPPPCPLFRAPSTRCARSRRRSPTVRTLRTPCLSAVYASICVRPLSTTRRRLHSRYSTSLDCITSQRAHRLTTNLTRSRPELNSTTTAEQTFFRVFAIPDVSGLQKSVSCFGSPLSPSLVPSLHSGRSGISGTHGRPTDRRLYCVLQRYPGSRAEMLQEVQRAHGQQYAFLVLYTPTWTNMFSLVRDLDRAYPHWQLARQLRNTRSVMARATSGTCWRSVLRLNQIQPILSRSHH